MSTVRIGARCGPVSERLLLHYCRYCIASVGVCVVKLNKKDQKSDRHVSLYKIGRHRSIDLVAAALTHALSVPASSISATIMGLFFAAISALRIVDASCLVIASKDSYPFSSGFQRQFFSACR